MFKLRDIVLPDSYDQGVLANALIKTVTYTFGDRFGKFGYDLMDKTAEGESETGITDVKTVALTHVVDATILVTEYASGKMGVIPLSSDERTFVDAHQELMSAIAALLGYDDYIVYQYTAVTSGKQSRLAYDVCYYDWSNNAAVDFLNHQVDYYDSRALWHPSNAPTTLFRRFDDTGFFGTDKVAANGIVRGNNYQLFIPMEYYMTDMQNVQDAAMKAVRDNKLVSDGQVEALTTALSGCASMIGSLAVFGNSVKDVADRYNSITRYIPRP